ncbi:MAG: diguanylate cyclase [Acidobacteria bacterium]|nr:diguanylate cyclase [Acidobacteriota bacterium]
MIDSGKRRAVSRRFPWQLIVVFILLAAGLFTLSQVFYGIQVKHARAYKEDALAARADLNALQIANWRDGLLTLADAYSEDPAHAALAQDLIEGRNAGPANQEIIGGLSGFQKKFPFEWATLALVGGEIVLKTPESAEVRSTPDSIRLGHEVWRTKNAGLGTISIDEATGRRSIDLLIPVLAAKGQSLEPIALLRLNFDPSKSLDPLLKTPPFQSPTSEALLLERVGDDFLALAAPRLQESAALPLRFPVRDFRRPASRDFLGEEGIIEGKDYRGAKVLGFIKAVPDSPWLVMAKIDLRELTTVMTSRYRVMLGIAGAFVLLCGILLCLFWRKTLAAQDAAERAKWDQANRHMDEFIQLVIDIMPNPAFFKDTQGLYRGTNSAFEKLLGLSKNDIIGKTIGDIASAEIAKRHQEQDQALLEKPGHQVYEAPLQAWDGEHHVIFIKTAYTRPDGTLGGIFGILKDITLRLRSEKELEQLRTFSDSTVQTMTEGLVLTDTEAKFTFVNPAAALMLGYTPAEMIDREVLSFVPKDQHAIVRRADEKRSQGISDRYELVFLHKDGSRRTFLVSAGPRVQGTQVGGTMAVLTDISERKRLEEEISALSLLDELTTLYNRRGFMTLAEQQLKTANRLKKRVALLYLDMDDLKKINDTGGHRMGDRALVEIAFILKNSFRESDIVGRLGGDEFSVLAMEATDMNVNILTARLQEKLDLFNSRSSAEAGFSLSASVGVCTREPENPATVEEMLSRADLLMYEQKRSKKSGGPGKPPGPSK